MPSRAACRDTKQSDTELPISDRHSLLQRFVVLEQLAQTFLSGRSFSRKRYDARLRSQHDAGLGFGPFGPPRFDPLTICGGVLDAAFRSRMLPGLIALS